MRIKQILAASTALALVSAIAPAQAGDLYISVFGGLNSLADESAAFTDESETHFIDTDADTGFVIGGTVGTHLDRWLKGLRVEVEASYRRNDLGGNWSEVEDFEGVTTYGGNIEGNMSTFALMANAWYDIDIGSKVRPYVGGGVGWGRMHGDSLMHTTFTDGDVPNSTCCEYSTQQENSGFAWQLGVGFHYEVAPDVDLGLGYRYFRGPAFNFFFEDFKHENENHAVSVDLTIGIN